MSHLTNPLATPSQLTVSSRLNSHIPQSAQDNIRFSTARLTQAAAVLLRLPQSVGAQAVVLLFRYWVVDGLMGHEFADVSAATLYLTAKVSPHPRSLRSIANVYTYLLSPASELSATPLPDPAKSYDPESYYLSSAAYTAFTARVLTLEGHVLNALGFNLHVSLPHPLSITYLQTLDLFTAAYPGVTGLKLARRVIALLNTALLSPQMLYLTHQPNALAVAAIYLAARQEKVSLPSVEWWKVFDVEREELGFLVVAFLSLEGWCRDIGQEMKGVLRRDGVRGLIGGEEIDEEAEMARMMDERAVQVE